MRKIVLVPLLLTAACAVGPDYERPFFSLPAGWTWSEPSAGEENAAAKKTVGIDWWKSFNDPALDRLIEEGLKANTDLAQAAARVSEARANLSYSEADFYPELDVQGSAERVSNSKESIVRGVRASSKPFNNFSLAAVVDWEIDLWGRLRRTAESDRAGLLSSEADRDAVRLAVASDIANGYFSLRAIDAQIEVTQHTIKAREGAFDYQEKQYKYGAANTLTYKQSEAELANARAQLPQLRQAKVRQETALGILLGRSPKELVETPVERGAGIDAIPVPPEIPADLPSSLLERRPDVQSAEQALKAANANIGIAKADYFPTLSLSALIGLTSSEADRLLRGSARNWQAGAGLAGPLLDFGRASSNADAAAARKDQAMAAYQRAVQTAFKDVIDTMNATKNTGEQEEASLHETDARAETLRLSELRYKEGYSNYLEVVDAERNLYQAQLDRITAKQDRLSAAVNLYKALGGGWPGKSGQ